MRIIINLASKEYSKCIEKYLQPEKMDTRFSSAIHTLILIAAADHSMTSEEIAVSVGTNPSYIRKITGLLRKKEIITSRQGARGFALTVTPEKLPLYDIYRAIYESEEVHVFDLHQNPNDECIVGRHIRPVLTDTFRQIEEKAEQELNGLTLKDCMDSMRKLIDKEDVK